jgi:hypothetical protein
VRGKLRFMIDFVGYGNRLAAVVDAHVGAGGLVGVYVHGSAALGGFRPERSDVDILVVVAYQVPADCQAALGEALLAAAYPCPGIGLELSVITAATAAHLGDCRFEDASVVRAALARQRSGATDEPSHDDVVAFVAAARSQIGS